MAAWTPALRGYRRLLTASRKLFAGDANALAMAHAELRNNFYANAQATGAELDAALTGIDEAHEMLTMNFVQGTLNERGNYEVTIEERHANSEVELHQADGSPIPGGCGDKKQADGGGGPTITHTPGTGGSNKK